MHKYRDLFLFLNLFYCDNAIIDHNVNISVDILYITACRINSG